MTNKAAYFRLRRIWYVVVISPLVVALALFAVAVVTGGPLPSWIFLAWAGFCLAGLTMFHFGSRRITSKQKWD